jgi:ubiquitin-protein ligase
MSDTNSNTKVSAASAETKVVTKEAINRLLKDVKQVLKYPLTDNGIYYVHDEADMLKGYAMIVGPEGTPYFGGYYFFDFTFPCDYPFSPPKVKYMTNDGITRFNPNLYKCGKVCVSILNTWTGDKWSSCQTINSILLTLCSLLNENPFLNEPGQTNGSRDCIAFNKSIAYSNIQFSVCKILNNCKGHLYPGYNLEKFNVFYPDLINLFEKNYDKLLDFVAKKSNSIETNDEHIVQLYGMKTQANYGKLLTILENYPRTNTKATV